jgi:hypothetical protein
MGAHSVHVTAVAGQDHPSVRRFAPDSEGAAQLRQIVLDTAFVAKVRSAYAALDLTMTPQIISTIVTRLVADGMSVESASEYNVEQALVYLEGEKKILLPC